MIFMLNKKHVLLYKTLSHPIRVEIICELLSNELGVGDLSRILGKRQSNVSQHLQILRRNDIVTSNKLGKHRIYKLNDEPRRLFQSLSNLEL